MKVIAHDERLTGQPNRGPDISVISVNENTSLGTFVSKFLMVYGAHGRIDKMKIFAHGLEVEYGGRARGGYGIQFCRESIAADTVEQLAPINGKVDKIAILACSIADTSTGMDAEVGGRRLHGNGQELCGNIARITGAEVIASTVSQLYVTENAFGETPMSFGAWEGAVLHFDRMGNLVRTTLRIEDH